MIFVSYNQADRTWAEWIAWILEEEGYEARIQAWDFHGNFVLEMDEAAKDAAKTIAILSRNYQTAEFTHPEWAAAFAKDPGSANNRLIPIRVGEVDLDGLLAQINYVDFVDRDEAAARSIDSLEKALHHATTLAKSGSLSDLNRLAVAYESLALSQADAARFEDAHAHAVASERLCAQLAAKQPDKFTRLWAGRLTNLSAALDSLGRFEEALETTEPSEAIHRKLALKKSDSLQYSWALSLDLLSTRLATLGDFEGAIKHNECAETITRELVAKQPDAFSRFYANVLSNLSLRLRDLERFEDALEKMQQAKAIRRDLAEKQPDEHMLEWAYDLANLSEAFVSFKRPLNAIWTGRQAVTLLPDLKRKPGDIRTHIAEGFCLRVLADALHQAGESTTTLAAAKRAACSLEAAFVERPDHVAEHYVQAIVTSAKCRQNTVDVDGALALLEKGTTAIKPLFEKRPRALQREMLRLIDGFRMIDPSAIDDRVPATILTTLGDLPPFRGTRSSLP